MFNSNIFVFSTLSAAIASAFFFSFDATTTTSASTIEVEKNAPLIINRKEISTAETSITPTNYTNTNTNTKADAPEPQLGIPVSFQLYKLGAGIADITGESAEANMFGYADEKQISSGIQQRLHARAFVIDDLNGKEILMVVADTGMISQAMHRELLIKLSDRYGDRFTKDNVVFTATHTHSAPGGYSRYFLYGLTTRGFQQATFDALITGSMRAVNKAVDSQRFGRLEFGTSELKNASIQRSYTAYKNNPEDTGNSDDAIDSMMQVLKFVDNDTSEEFASMNWFAVHPTSLSSRNTLVSGDNKGYAAWYWETQKGMDYLKGEGYVAAFANSNPGDMSPNMSLKPGKGPTDDQWQNAKIMGQRQADAAMKTETPLDIMGNIDYRQNYVDFSKEKIDAKYTVDGKEYTTCLAAYKTAFAAGSSEDGGGGESLVASGMVAEGVDNPLIQAVGHMMFWPSKELKECHETNQVAIAMGKIKPTPMSPEVLPNQLIKLGNLAIISVPSEFTVTSGKRIRKQVAETLQIPYENVIFSGYSNAYAGYITTPEEYKQQDYEGASTHFGPHTFEAWLQNVDELALAIKNGDPVETEIEPRDLSGTEMTSVVGVVYDNVPFGKEFGQVDTQPKTTYDQGDIATAVFWSSHPKSTLAYELEVDESGLRKTEPYTMAVQRKEGNQWVTVATDNDWNTTNQWKRIGTARSHATLTWDIPQNAKSGEYRFYHRAAYKNGWTGKHVPFDGYSDSFSIN